MKNLLSLAAVAGIVATMAPAAQAEEFVARYTYLVNGTAASAQTLVQPAIVDGCGVQTLPAVVDSCGLQTLPAVVGGTAPIMVQDHENIVPHFFHLGLWPLIDFSIF